MDAVATVPLPSPPLRPIWLERRAVRVGLAVVSALLLASAYPLLRLWPVAWVALTPLYVLLVTAPQPGRVPGGRNARAGGWAGFWLGFVLHVAGSYWMLILGSVPWIVLAAIEATPFALWGALSAWLLPRLRPDLRPLAFACTWVVLEFLRYQTKYAFPWFPLAATQAPAPVLLQVVSFTGQWGISFAIALSGALFGQAFLAPAPKRQRIIRFLMPLAVVAGVAGLGAIAYLVDSESFRAGDDDHEPANARTVGIAQGSLFRDGEDKPGVYSDLTQSLSKSGAQPLDLIVWPETPLPNDVLSDPFTRPRLSALARGVKTPLLLGNETSTGRDLYNSAVLFDSKGGIAGRYDKQQLVPMGEFFLFRTFLDRIYEEYGVSSPDLTPGQRVGIMNVGTRDRPMRVGVLICYESAFPMRARDCVLAGADVITLLTSDATFGETAGPSQHADMSVLRAIETRRYVVRAALTGTSEFIAPDGRIIQSLGLMERGTLHQRIGLRHYQTLYVRVGDWFVWGAVTFCAWAVWQAMGAPKAKTP